MTQTLTDVRHKAAAILSGHKLRMLEEAGLTVVEKQRLEAFERLYEAELRLHSPQLGYWEGEDVEDAIDSVVKELEAMERE